MPLGSALIGALAAAPVRALPELAGPCEDPRYPQMAGEWAVGCGASGRVDRALHLETGEVLELERAVISPAVGPGVLYSPGIPSLIWRLPLAEPREAAPVPGEILAPPATDGERAALSTAEGIAWLELSGSLRFSLPGWPVAWEAPAVSGPWTAWVGVADGIPEIWLAGEGAAPTRLDQGAGVRHVAADSGWLGWIRDDGAVLYRLSDGERRLYPGDLRTGRRLSLWGEVGCWEQWNGQDVDAVCSDGASAGGPGHQRNPSRWGRWLLYQQGDQTLLMELP